MFLDISMLSCQFKRYRPAATVNTVSVWLITVVRQDAVGSIVRQNQNGFENRCRIKIKTDFIAEF